MMVVEGAECAVSLSCEEWNNWLLLRTRQLSWANLGNQTQGPGAVQDDFQGPGPNGGIDGRSSLPQDAVYNERGEAERPGGAAAPCQLSTHLWVRQQSHGAKSIPTTEVLSEYCCLLMWNLALGTLG